jgi:hypothetical protein
MDTVTHFLKPPDTKQVPRANATNPAIRTQVVEFTEKFSNWLDLKPCNGIKLVINADDIAPAIKSTVAERKQKTVISSWRLSLVGLSLSFRNWLVTIVKLKPASNPAKTKKLSISERLIMLSISHLQKNIF